jgi:hypothetical protein
MVADLREKNAAQKIFAILPEKSAPHETAIILHAFLVPPVFAGSKNRE